MGRVSQRVGVGVEEERELTVDSSESKVLEGKESAKRKTKKEKSKSFTTEGTESTEVAERRERDSSHKKACNAKP